MITGDTANIVNAIIERIGKGPLALFCGAGVMHETKMPIWKELLKSLMADVVDTRTGSEFSLDDRKEIKKMLATDGRLSLYEQADIVRILFRGQYLYQIRKHIYEQCPLPLLRNDPINEKDLYYDKDKTMPILRSVVGLCKHERVSAVVTYNYEDILLRAVKGKPNSRHAYHICGRERPEAIPNALPIYYIHGYLPYAYTTPNAEESQLVLSYDSYFNNTMEAFSWQTTTQLHFLQNTACLFVGTSLTDINMLRMLRYAKNYSRKTRIMAIIAKPDIVGGVKLNSAMRFLITAKSMYLDDAGVELILVDDYPDTPKVLFELADKLPRPRAGN